MTGCALPDQLVSDGKIMKAIWNHQKTCIFDWNLSSINSPDSW